MADNTRFSKVPHKTSTCGVKVSTWGSDTNGGNGILQFIDSKFFGANLGHASITLTIPVDKSGKADKLIAEYCNNENKPKIPFVKKTVTVMKAEIDPKTQKPIPGQEIAHQEEVYEIYFSWWPGARKYNLRQNLEVDSASERDAVPFEWSPEWREYINPETRRYKAKFGDRFMEFGPANIFHARNLPANETQEMAYVAVYTDLSRESHSLDLLLQKLNFDPNKEFKIETTARILLNRFIPNWEEKIKKENSPEEKRQILQRLALEKSEKYKRATFQLQRYPYLPLFKNIIGLISRVPINQEFIKQSIEYLEGQKYIIDDKTKSKNDLIQEVLPQYGTFLYKLNELKEPITEEDTKALSDALELKMNEIKRDVHDIAPHLQFPEHAFDFELGTKYLTEEYRTRGKPPDNIVKLPLSLNSFPNSGIGHSHGLDAEAMLKQMQFLIQDDQPGFHLFCKNCSLTVGSILEAGVKEPYLREIFRNKAFGFFGTPQEVYNNSANVRNAIYSGKTKKPAGIFSRKVVDPLEQGFGYCMNIILNPEPGRKGNLETAGAYAGAVAIGIIGLIALPIKKMANPLKAFEETKDFMNFVLKRPFKKGAKILQGLLLIGAAIGLALFAIPAGIQQGINLIKEKAKKESPEVLKKREQAFLAEKEHEKHEFQRVRAAMERNKQARIQSALAKGLKEKTKTIEGNDPIEALRKFKKELDKKTNIPVFSSKTQSLIIKYFHKSPDVPPDLAPFGSTIKEVYRNFYDQSHQLLKSFEKEILKTVQEQNKILKEPALRQYVPAPAPMPKLKSPPKIPHEKPEVTKKVEHGLGGYKAHSRKHEETHKTKHAHAREIKTNKPKPKKEK